MRRMTLSLYIIYVEETIPQIQTLLQNLIKERSRYFEASSPWAVIRPCRLHIKGKEKLILFYITVNSVLYNSLPSLSFCCLNPEFLVCSSFVFYSPMNSIDERSYTAWWKCVLTQYSTLLHNCCTTKLSTMFVLLRNANVPIMSSLLLLPPICPYSSLLSAVWPHP